MATEDSASRKTSNVFFLKTFKLFDLRYFVPFDYRKKKKGILKEVMLYFE